MQSRNAGGCTVPFISAAFLSAWQVRHRACGVVVISFTRVTSLVVRISWQLVQPMAIAECTDLPLVLSSWQARQVAGSAFGSSGTGCFAADTRPTKMRTNRKQPSALSVRLVPGLDLNDFSATLPAPPYVLLHASRLISSATVDSCTIRATDCNVVTWESRSTLPKIPTVAGFIRLGAYPTVKWSKWRKQIIGQGSSHQWPVIDP